MPGACCPRLAVIAHAIFWIFDKIGFAQDNPFFKIHAQLNAGRNEASQEAHGGLELTTYFTDKPDSVSEEEALEPFFGASFNWAGGSVEFCLAWGGSRFCLLQACGSDEDCGAATPFCLKGALCVECEEDEDCADRSDGKTVCDTLHVYSLLEGHPPTYQCVEPKPNGARCYRDETCASNACGPNWRIDGDKYCYECELDSECPPEKPICQTVDFLEADPSWTQIIADATFTNTGISVKVDDQPGMNTCIPKPGLEGYCWEDDTCGSGSCYKPSRTCQCMPGTGVGGGGCDDDEECFDVSMYRANVCIRANANLDNDRVCGKNEHCKSGCCSVPFAGQNTCQDDGFFVNCVG